jgi:FixJ family two-component response regulator
MTSRLTDESSSAAAKRGRVLIVDDESFFREAIDEILEEAGFRARSAEDGRSALEAVQAPDLGAVVLDVRLPDIDGIQVLARIREMRPELPVIMLSASTDQEIVLEALRLGAHDYLAKPLHDEELVLAVGRALEGHEVIAGRRRLQARIDRLVEGMERLSRLVRMASAEERAAVLREGIVEAAVDVLEIERVSLMLIDSAGERLEVVATSAAGLEPEAMTPRKVGEGASGIGFEHSVLLCVPDASRDDRFVGRAMAEYEGDAFAIVPLVCLGVPVGVLCLTDGAKGSDLFLEEKNLLRLLGMQVSEFLAADPAVELLLQSASAMDIEGAEPMAGPTFDGDAEIARAVCEAVAAETDPERMLARALAAVSRQLGAAPVSLFLLSPDGSKFDREAEADGGRVSDRVVLPTKLGLVGQVCQSGQLVAAPHPEQDARFKPSIDTPADGETRPYLCIPLKLRDKVVGLLRVFLEPGAPASARTAEVLAAAFSAALRNMLLYRSLLQSIEEVAQARRESRS